MQPRTVGNLSFLVPSAPAPATRLQACLGQLQAHWRREENLAALWQAWPGIAGAQLAPHCRPLRLQGGRLVVGASHPQWLQALRFNKHRLLGALRGAGFSVKDLVLQQHQPSTLPPFGSDEEAQVWAHHPSRVDVFGMGNCPSCQRPAPAGEVQRWGHCSFCQRERMDNGVAMGTPACDQ
jgi:predicted nucleic acid-binding Zn ribbon protein